MLDSATVTVLCKVQQLPCYVTAIVMPQLTYDTVGSGLSWKFDNSYIFHAEQIFSFQKPAIVVYKLE